MPKRIVIADASVLIGLNQIDCLDLLKEMYTSVEITSIVKEEIGIIQPAWIKINDNYNSAIFRSLIPRLDQGEASSIALALEYEDSLLIIDERKGRNQAKEMGVRITGLLGIIIRAKKVGLIASGKREVRDPVQSRVSYFSEIIHSCT
ncbi:MAG: DUF3368 domain-containing protein [Bacteroidota bacterium]